MTWIVRCNHAEETGSFTPQDLELAKSIQTAQDPRIPRYRNGAIEDNELRQLCLVFESVVRHNQIGNGKRIILAIERRAREILE